MHIILSSSKTQNFSEINIKQTTSLPIHQHEANDRISELQTLSLKKCKEYFRVSDALAKKVHTQLKKFNKETTVSKAALFAYSGTVFIPFQHQSFSKEQLGYAQQHLFILSGLYGALRPLDIIKPYRLEMKQANDTIKSLVVSDLQRCSKPIINLASSESLSAVQKKQLDSIVDISFLQKKNGVSKTIAVYAKKARGLMASWIISQMCRDISQITTFSEDGYVYKKDMSSTSLLVFEKELS